VLNNLAVPMYGRRIHGIDGNLSFQAYGKSDQYINSIGRGSLNQLLIRKALNLGVDFLFEYTCDAYNEADQVWSFISGTGDKILTSPNEIVIGADGAFSVIRENLFSTEDKKYKLATLDYGYIELDISAEQAKGSMDSDSLHIWPRERFMLIALPNNDGSLTATLFLPFEGDVSFYGLKTEKNINDFFDKYFSDAKKIIPDLNKQFNLHPVSGLFLVHADKWSNSHSLLIGDAAHALVPFYGQGMNAGFEDCRILAEIMDNQSDLNWEKIFKEFFSQRKNNADAISELALQNFTEMRDLVADRSFLVRKQIESYIASVFPDLFIPQYTMVSFTDIPYSEAFQTGNRHKELLNKIMCVSGIEAEWPNDLLREKVKKIALTFL